VEPVSERPLGELLREISEEGKRLLRAELTVARVELKDEAKKASAGAGLFGAGGVVALLAAMALTAGLIALLALVLPLWASALIVAGVLGAVAAVCLVAGRKAFQKVNAKKAIQPLKEDGQWASETLRAARQKTPAHA